MEYLHQELDLQPDEVVEVILDNAANVMLMDPSNYRAYQEKRPYRYHGGHVTQTPFRLRAPHPGKWHVVVDLGGGPGIVRATVRVISGAAVA